MAESDGEKQIAGMSPIAFVALAIFTVVLICYGIFGAGNDEWTEPVDGPRSTVSTR